MHGEPSSSLNENQEEKKSKINDSDDIVIDQNSYNDLATFDQSHASGTPYWPREPGRNGRVSAPFSAVQTPSNSRWAGIPSNKREELRAINVRGDPPDPY